MYQSAIQWGVNQWAKYLQVGRKENGIERENFFRMACDNAQWVGTWYFDQRIVPMLYVLSIFHRILRISNREICWNKRVRIFLRPLGSEMSNPRFMDIAYKKWQYLVILRYLEYLMEFEPTTKLNQLRADNAQD